MTTQPTGLADPKRLAIDGGSAGGYTTLGALTFRDVFTAGCSLYLDPNGERIRDRNPSDEKGDPIEEGLHVFLILKSTLILEYLKKNRATFQLKNDCSPTKKRHSNLGEKKTVMCHFFHFKSGLDDSLGIFPMMVFVTSIPMMTQLPDSAEVWSCRFGHLSWRYTQI